MASRVMEMCLENKEECSENFAQLLKISKLLQIKLQTLGGNVALIPHLLDCERFHSIYVDTAHSSACLQSKIGFIWIIVSLFSMIFLGMIVVMLRSSWLDDQVLIESERMILPSNNNDSLQIHEDEQSLCVSVRKDKQLCEEDANDISLNTIDEQSRRDDCGDETIDKSPNLTTPLLHDNNDDGEL